LNGFLITIKGYFTKYPTVSSGTLDGIINKASYDMLHGTLSPSASENADTKMHKEK
jgi:hypothetical protein